MNKEELLKLAKDKLKYINEEIRELSNVLDELEYDYEMSLETTDYSTIEHKRTYIQLNVALKRDLPSCAVKNYE